MRRLTRVEYDNTVFQLLGDASRPSLNFVPDEEAGGFDNQAEALVVSPLLAEQYMTAAEDLAEAHADKLLADVPECAMSMTDLDACRQAMRGFIQGFGKRAFRRPLEADEVDKHMALFEVGLGMGDGPNDTRTGLRLVVAAMLQSPAFLYRVVFGMPDPVEGDVVPLTSYEMASRLSYLFWNSMPDAALLEAADRDELRTPEQIEEQARRLLASPRARAAVRNFHRQWLGLGKIDFIAANGKDPDLYPDYDDSLLPLWREEIESFLDHAVFDEDASLSDIFTAPYSMMNRKLAEFYGVKDGPQGSLFEPVDLDPERNAGFLSRAGLMALYAKRDRTSPVLRGKFVRERLLCQVPPPPPDIIPEPPEVDENTTTREQMAEHESNPVCAGCHVLMDPIGLGFEHYDAIGRWRDQEKGQPIDATGSITATEQDDGDFDGAVELAQRLGSSTQVRDCVVTQWFRFAYGRGETLDDTCSLDTLKAEFAAAGYDIKELLVALSKTDAFRYRRRVAPAGEMP